jgi:hypothetical protein
MGLLKEVAGAVLAPVTGGASLAMTGSGRKKRGGDLSGIGGSSEGSGEGSGEGSDDSGGGEYSADRILKRVGRRMAGKRS